MILADSLRSSSIPFCPLNTIREWLAQQPAITGFALIVPDNLDLLEIVAAPFQTHTLQTRIKDRITAHFGTNHVIGGETMDGVLVAFATGDQDVCKSRIDQVLQEIAQIKLEHSGGTISLTARAGIIWIGTECDISPELVRRKLVSSIVAARREHLSCFVQNARDSDKVSKTELTAQLICDLPGAIAENRLQLNAQDIIALGSRSDAPHQIEVLVRMRDRRGNQYPPSDFLPVAENSALIEMIDQWVIQRVFNHFGAELRARPQLWISINISAPTLSNPTFAAFLTDTLRNSQIDPRRVQLEITETAAIGNLEQAQSNIHAVRKLGCRIALDDFGDGLSSYGYVKAFAPDCIKIDGALIPNVVDPENVEAQIVKSIIRLAHRLNIEVVAEHVSSPEILNTLREFGIDKVQGFELGRPRPLSQLFDGGDHMQEQGDHVE